MTDLEIQEQEEKMYPIPDRTGQDIYNQSDLRENMQDAFKAGAKWMQEQDELESKAVELLRKLVALKVYYTLNHPQAWQDAKEFLAKMPLPSPPKTK